MKHHVSSATLSTWLSLCSRAALVIGTAPFVAVQLPVTEVALWFLFVTIASLQVIADLGFGITFSRLIAYRLDPSSAGSSATASSFEGGATSGTLSDVVGAMQLVYRRLSVVWFGAVTIIGWTTCRSLIGQLENPTDGLAALLVIVLTSTIRIYGLQHWWHLYALGAISVSKMWEAVAWLIGTLLTLLVLLLDGGLVLLALCYQVPLVLASVANRVLVIRHVRAHTFRYSLMSATSPVVRQAWAQAWRSGVGILAYWGTVQLAAIWFANDLAPQDSATFLFAFTLLTQVSMFSSVPVMTSLPQVTRQFASHNRVGALHTALSGMRLGYLTYAALVWAIALARELFSSSWLPESRFPSVSVIGLIALAMYLDRLAATHLQLHAVANRVVWHVANGLAGTIFLVIALPLFETDLGVLAVPVAQILTNVLFLWWFSAKQAYGVFRTHFLAVEPCTSIVPLMALVALIAWGQFP